MVSFRRKCQESTRNLETQRSRTRVGRAEVVSSAEVGGYTNRPPKLAQATINNGCTPRRPIVAQKLAAKLSARLPGGSKTAQRPLLSKLHNLHLAPPAASPLSGGRNKEKEHGASPILLLVYLFLLVLFLHRVVRHPVPEVARQLATAEKAAVENLHALRCRVRRPKLFASFEPRGNMNGNQVSW